MSLGKLAGLINQASGVSKSQPPLSSGSQTRGEEFPVTPVRDRQDDYPKTPKKVNGLQLANQGLGDKRISEVMTKLPRAHGHVALFLSGNQIGGVGSQAIATRLSSDQVVKHLILSNNFISDFAMAGLADMLKVNHHIGWLVLNGNAIGKFGARVLGEALALNVSIKHLILADNEIDDEGVEVLAEKLKGHPTLKSLFLQGNPFGERGLRALLEFLRSFDHFQVLDARAQETFSQPVAQQFLHSTSRMTVLVRV